MLIDVQYAIRQIRHNLDYQATSGRRDSLQRALDALERVEAGLAGATVLSPTMTPDEAQAAWEAFQYGPICLGPDEMAEPDEGCLKCRSCGTRVPDGSGLCVACE